VFSTFRSAENFSVLGYMQTQQMELVWVRFSFVQFFGWFGLVFLVLNLFQTLVLRSRDLVESISGNSLSLFDFVMA